MRVWLLNIIVWHLCNVRVTLGLYIHSWMYKYRLNSYKWPSYCSPSNISSRHNPPAQSYNTYRASTSMAAWGTIEGDPAQRYRLDTWPIMLTPDSEGIVSTGNSTIERLGMRRWLYHEGIIYCGDISRFMHNNIDHLLTDIKQLGLSARYLHLILRYLKLQYRNNKYIL